MPITVNVNGTLKTLTAITANVSGTLKTLTEVQTNVSGTLKQIHCVLPSTISGTCSGVTGSMHKTTITATSCKVVGSLILVSNALSSSGYTVSGAAILSAFKEPYFFAAAALTYWTMWNVTHNCVMVIAVYTLIAACFYLLLSDYILTHQLRHNFNSFAP